MSYENSAGLGVRNHYGPKLMSEAVGFGGQVSTSGRKKTLEWGFAYDNLLAAPSSAMGMDQYIPAGAMILSAKIQVITGFAGGTSYDIGGYDSAGTAINADGLFDALVTAAINVADDWVDSSDYTGADVDGNHAVTADYYPVVAATGTFTAGEARLIVEYIDAERDPTGNYTAGGVKGG